MKNYRILSLFIMMVVILSACNMPSATPTEQVNPNAVFTAAAETVVAQLTQSALLNPTSAPPTVAPPTNTPAPAAAPTNTPGLSLPLPTATQGVVIAPTVGCDAAQFVTDVSIPDGTSFNGGATFTKTWRLKNVGTCTWNSSYALVFDSGSNMGGASSIPLSSTVAPGGSIDVSVNLQAPNADGTYRGFWGITNASGARIPVAGGASGRSFYVEIRVGAGGPTPGGTPNADSCGGKFCVTSVKFDITSNGACSSRAYTINATVSTNKAGEVTYTWIRSDGATGASNSGTLSFDNAGSQTITFNWTFGGGGQWVDLYVDKPNHQQFGRANLNCP